LARADELNFNALIKPAIVEGIQGDDIKEGNESNLDILLDNKLDISPDNKVDISPDNKIDNQLDIPLASQATSDLSKKKTRETSSQKTGKQTSKNDKQKDSQPELESPLAALIASKKKRKEDKVFVGLHLPRDVDEVLTQFKKDTDIDRSEAVASFVRIMLKDYFK